MQKLSMSLGLLALGAVLVAGCHHDEPSSTVMTPTTMPSAPEVPGLKAPAEKDLTHVLTKDEPYYTDMPGATPPAAAGTVKTGSKVLVLIPGFPYSQVMTDTGVTAYLMTEGLKPLGK